MTERFHYSAGRDALGEEQARAGMAQVMEALIAEIGLAENPFEARDFQPSVERRPIPAREHISLILPAWAGEQAGFELSRAMRAECGYDGSRHGIVRRLRDVLHGTRCKPVL